MITGFKYELWDGKKVVGYYTCLYPLNIVGRYMVFHMISTFKQKYNKQYETITVPITTRLISDNGIDYTIRRALDVRKKSKRQINLLKMGSSLL